MKKTLFTLCLALIVNWVEAQTAITLTQTNVPALTVGTIHSHTASAALITPPSTGTNQVWDYSSLSGGTAYNISFLAAPTFSSTAVLDTTGFEYLTTTYGFKTGYVYDMDANGFYYAGNIVPGQKYALTSFTGSNKDSLNVPKQTSKFRENLIAFPTTAATKWITNYVHTINFQLTVAAYMLNNVPSKKITHSTINDSVAGWGTLRIPSSNKASIPYACLMIKRHITDIDSFYLGGLAAPTALLTIFGTSQAKQTITNLELFYRAGSPRPLFVINYGSDNTYKTPSSSYYTTDNVTSGIENDAKNDFNFGLYPNPATSGFVNCQISKASSASWTLNIMNQLGQVIRTQKIDGTGNLNLSVDINMVKNGLYFLNVMDENGMKTATGKLTVSK